MDFYSDVRERSASLHSLQDHRLFVYPPTHQSTINYTHISPLNLICSAELIPIKKSPTEKIVEERSSESDDDWQRSPHLPEYQVLQPVFSREGRVTSFSPTPWAPIPAPTLRSCASMSSLHQISCGEVKHSFRNPRRRLCGSSTVAIDNKIEQAMDLVKSHLMFAVREEVDVLKEQIRDLVERMSQLEYENGILRAAATPETLALLAQPRQPPPPSSS